jgi:two-component system phosphate regulon response regulator PhoB
MQDQSNRGSGKILAVDDDLHMRIFLTTLFKTAGYEIEVTRDGKEGMRKAREISPDLIVLDVMMPAEGGTPMYRQLKTDDDLKHIPVIMLTGVEGATFSHSLKLISAVEGAPLPEPDGYMEKPPDADRLLEMARELLGNKNS